MSVIELRRPELLETRCLVGGEWVSGERTFSVSNPATGAEIAQVPSLGREEVKRAAAAAAAAMPAWAGQTAKQRASVLRRWFDLMVANADDLAAIMTAEQGKP